MSTALELISSFQPAGDQPQAIALIAAGLDAGKPFQTLMGVTGSGKTYTLANIIVHSQRPTLIITHNKTLAAQLYSEYKNFFPRNAVEYFVSYYDYYLPEAYLPQTDTYIAKDSSINDELEKLRLSTTSSLFERRDVVVVASVSCIFGLGSPEDIANMSFQVETEMNMAREEFLLALVNLRYDRNDVECQRGGFRVNGDTVDVYPAYQDHLVRFEFWGDTVERITIRAILTNKIMATPPSVRIFPAKHFLLPPDRFIKVKDEIIREMNERVRYFEQAGRYVEAQRIYQRTTYDLEMMEEIGYCSGIENYSRYLSGREPGSTPYTLLNYFPDDFIVIIDESHVTLPQLRAMYAGDRSRKLTLVEHGFRLPSALDNRPLDFNEFCRAVKQCIFVSATPGPFEWEVSQPVELVIRPTGLLDPEIIVRPLDNQVDDLIAEIRATSSSGHKIIVSTLTKRTAEDLTEYLQEIGIRVKYIHSEIDTIERVEILRELRAGDFDCLVGINLLREGLDLPEVGLVAILDADKEGFLRSETSLIQMAGRAARNVEGRVIFYADTQTNSIKRVIAVCNQRRQRQQAYNELHGIRPRTVTRSHQESLSLYQNPRQSRKEEIAAMHEDSEPYHLDDHIVLLEQEMMIAAEKLEFEHAAMLRDHIARIKAKTDEPITPKKKKRH